jgi:hypothetical protein
VAGSGVCRDSTASVHVGRLFGGRRGYQWAFARIDIKCTILPRC